MENQRKTITFGPVGKYDNLYLQDQDFPVVPKDVTRTVK